MPEYRVYLIGTDNHFLDVQAIVCASDDEARVKAFGLIGSYPPLEIWCEARFIGKIAAAKPLS